MLEAAHVTENNRTLGDFDFAGDDHVVPFEVAPLDVRGRIVQLGPMLDQILARHDYPAAVAAGKARPEDLLGHGVLALTIDQGPHTQRYQGVVQLDGETFVELHNANGTLAMYRVLDGANPSIRRVPVEDWPTEYRPV